MTDQGTHTPTAQETQIYDALTAGDHDTIAELRDTAYGADQSPPADATEDWLAPAAQFDVDYHYAWTHYQADHEAPEGARETATKAEVAGENTEAELAG